MAKQKIFRFVQVGVLGAALTALAPACTDDHFDVQDGGGVGANATQTLWEQIKATQNLSRFATLVEKTPYFKDEAHPVKDYYFKDVLNGTQILTVFAPTNDAFTDAEYQELLGLCQTDPYDVYLRLVGNHITRNRYTATGTGEENLVMVNSKKATFNRAAKTFKDIPLLTSNIPAVNGTLHIIGQQSPFSYNIYEYIKAHGNEFGHLKEWVTAHDTIYFNTALSAEGGSDANGNPIYVDSVYSRLNTLFSKSYTKTGEEWVMPLKGFGFSGSLEYEDSTYAMILPTDAAWEAAKADMLPYYNYADSYADMYRENRDNASSAIPGNNNWLTEFNRSAPTISGAPDSLQELAINMDLASPLLFNIRQQPRLHGQTGFWNAESFQQTPMPKMFNMRVDTFRVEKETVGDVKALLFDNQTPVTVSNGLVYPVNNWNFMKVYGAKDVIVKANAMAVFKRSYMAPTTTSWETFDNTGKLVTDSLLGAITASGNQYGFLYVQNGTSQPNVTFKLTDDENDHQVLSGITYEVHIVMVPDFYRYDNDSIASDVLMNKLEARISYRGLNDRGVIAEINSSKMSFEYDGQSVQDLLIGEIQFPYSYKNIENSYPLINITSSARSSDLRGGYQHAFSLDRIYLKAKEE